MSSDFGRSAAALFSCLLKRRSLTGVVVVDCPLAEVIPNANASVTMSLMDARCADMLNPSVALNLDNMEGAK